MHGSSIFVCVWTCEWCEWRITCSSLSISLLSQPGRVNHTLKLEPEWEDVVVVLVEMGGAVVVVHLPRPPCPQHMFVRWGFSTNQVDIVDTSLCNFV